MNEETKSALAGYLADASSKLAALPARVAAEKAAAAADGVRAVPIVPKTELAPRFIGQALEAIKDIPSAELQETVGTWRRVCQKYPQDSFCAPSAQVVAVLHLAGLTNA